jgi:hypothetical protein
LAISADYEQGAKRLMEGQLALPAYEQVLKAAHTFNLLDARGAISVTERTGLYRTHSRAGPGRAQSYYDSRERLGFPMLAKARGRMTAPLVVELLCEELPPKALARLGAAFAEGIRAGLAKRGLVAEPGDALVFCTPRRLAMGLRRCARFASRARSSRS